MIQRSPFSFALVACGLLFAAACGDDGGTGGASSTSSGSSSSGQGGDASTSSQSSGSTSSSTTGSGGAGGGAGGGPADPGAPGSGLVSAGDRASSPNYTAVHTTGQPTINSEKMTSPNFRLQGGLIGATGSLP